MIDTWLDGVWSASLRGGVALSAAWLVCLTPRVPVVVQCWVLRAAYVVVLIAFLWITPLDLPLRRSTAVPPSRVHGFTITTNVPDPATVSIKTDASPFKSLTTHSGVLPRLSFCIWITFVTIYLGRLCMGWFISRRFRGGRLVRLPEITPLCRAMGISRPPIARIHPLAIEPLLVGVWWPAIVLPESLAESPDRRFIVAHELAHLRRLDLLWNWLPTLATALLPMHPLVWMCNRRWRLASESACDADAISFTAADAAEYGRALVEMTISPQRYPLNVLAVGATSESCWLLKRRLRAMANRISWNRRRQAVVGIVVSVTTAFAAVPWRVVAEKPPFARSPMRTLELNNSSDNPTSQTTPKRVDAALSKRFGQHSGNITAAIADLVATTSGTLVAIKFQEGQPVKAGDVLYQIDDAAQRAKFDYAKADFENQRALLTRKSELFKQASVSEFEIAQYKLELELKKAQMSLAQLELDRTRITAPFDGILEACELQVGELVNEHQELSKLVQTGQLKVMLYVDLSAMSGVQTGMVVSVNTGHGDALATITYMAPAADPASNTMVVKARLNSSPLDLTVGRRCEVTLPETK